MTPTSQLSHASTGRPRHTFCIDETARPVLIGRTHLDAFPGGDGA
jgi:hypothetical protein